jgi:hypothetical protein
LVVAVLALSALGSPEPAGAGDAIAGVCPDGSMFVVARPEDAPCARAKFVEPSELPPLRPEYLPRPYLWQVDQELRQESNPYNLIDRAQALRELRSGVGKAEPAAVTATAGARPRELAPAPVQGPAAAPALSDAQLRDLAQLIALRQDLAPAALVVDDAAGLEQLPLRFAYSTSAESLVRGALGESAGRVLVFSARASQASEFHPNFLVAQGGATFRPDPEQARESGLLLGRPGALPRGELLLGYLVLPERFDPARPLRIWWNDRELEATLSPPGS